MEFERHGRSFRLEPLKGRGMVLSYWSTILRAWRRLQRVRGKGEANRLIDIHFETRTGAFSAASYWDDPKVTKRAKNTVTNAPEYCYSKGGNS